MSMTYCKAIVGIIKEGVAPKRFDFEYDNEICPELCIDDNWVKKINTKDDFVSLIENSFIDKYEDMDDNEVRDNLAQTISAFKNQFVEEQYQELINIIEQIYSGGEKIDYLLLGVSVGPGERALFKWVKYDFINKIKYSEDNNDINSVNANQQEQFLERVIQKALSYKMK